ncbi:ATP-binding cassette domain-containing protein [Tissierella sp. MB52-C2]|uniref:ATP-binding cassette domain-containing protein n=1 Tax=Tissierella sp. MB52-C2 TaxID=3070999 RepID=UPI00280A746A|nr:ATP-binding cassette domain-containing protein [Tissierella sp. MB52-C2]WMM23298.1 ATP-binding cassette domain-containing protein [Tissierella sp. MB52-C2]
MDCILQTCELSKTYENTLALDNVNIRIEKGGIYGFVGQNGAGKTTFMRIVSGLSFPNKGDIELFGVSDKKGLAEERKRMGCIIETPAFYPYMTASENMEAMRITQGIPNKKVVNQALEIVGLSDTGKKKIQNFSMGMKQRLGIATALLGEPEFLMLDEPTNGLDPVSIVEIRELLIRLVAEKQITILISSHILSELYSLATNYIIIHQGRILQSITKKQLDERCKKHISIHVNDVSHAVTVLERNLFTRNYKVMPDNSITLYDFIDDIQRVITAFSEHNLIIKNIMVAGDSLENYFVNTIGGINHV